MLICASSMLFYTAGVITDGPSTQVVLLNEFPQFQCRTARSAPRWIINDMDLDPVQKQYEDERGIRKILRSQIGSIDYVSVLEVHAIEINNNTVLQCAVYSGDAESEAAVLIIQGILFTIEQLFRGGPELSVDQFWGPGLFTWFFLNLVFAYFMFYSGFFLNPLLHACALPFIPNIGYYIIT